MQFWVVIKPGYEKFVCSHNKLTVLRDELVMTGLVSLGEICPFQEESGILHMFLPIRWQKILLLNTKE